MALSYRGFWSSTGRPSQKGIERDAAAVLDWVSDEFAAGQGDVKLVLWGQSIGAGVAAIAAAHYQRQPSRILEVDGLLLETPFLNVRSMLVSLYPQRFLPYRYLWPFLRSHWNTEEALYDIASSEGPTKPKILVLQAGRDELVPSEHGLELEAVARTYGLDVRRVEVSGALHTEIIAKASGRRSVVTFLEGIGGR